MRLLAVTVLYYPGDKEFENIGNYLPWVDKLVVWDNTPRNEKSVDTPIKDRICGLYPQENSKLVFMTTGDNEGLSYAYNRALDYMKDNGYDLILIMDQDSQWVRFKDFRLFCEDYISRHGPCLIGPEIVEPAIGEQVSKETPAIHHFEFIINSGMIFPLEVFEKLGYYCERFLVDTVDTEFCFRAHKAGVQVLYVTGHGFLNQKYGEKNFFYFRQRRWPCCNYSPRRLFGQLRNQVLLARIYPENKILRSLIKDVCLKQYTIAILLNEGDKLRKLYSIYSGFIHGLFTCKSLDSRYSKA